MSPKMLRKLSSILDRQQKIKILGLTVLILIGGILETLGISLIVPLLSAILDEQSFAENSIVIWVMDLLGIQNIRSFIYLLLFGLIFMYVFKCAYLIGLTYVQARFVNRNRSRSTTNLLSQFLHRPYEYYLYAETSTIVRTIYGDMDNISNLLLQVMGLMSEIVICLFMGGFLLLVDFKMMCMVVGLLLLVTIFSSKVIKPRLNRVGDGARDEQAGMYKWILQSASGIKDVKVANKEDYFTGRYRECVEGYGYYQIRHNVYTNMPRLLIESIAIIAILLYLALSMIMGVDLTSMVPAISAFALAAMRLLPSVNRVNTYIANIAYYESALNYIYENVDTDAMSRQEELDAYRLANPNTTPITLEKEITLNDITFAYPNTDKKIFDQADMKIPVGKSVGVVGPSGSGKTTIVDVLLGLLEPQNGTITSDGTNIMENYEAWLKHVGYIPQTIYMLDDSIRNNIAFGVKEEDIDDARIWEVLEKAQMREFVELLPDKLDSQIGERGVRISGGQRQRLGIARALYHDPELLIFDEATSALDNDTETAIMEAIDTLHGQKTMVIIAHRLRTIENCDIIYEVNGGKILMQRGMAE